MIKQENVPGAAVDMVIVDLLAGRGGHAGRNRQPVQLYRIGDLAEEFDLTLRTLRFYEDKGLLSPRRAGVTRLYDHNDHARLRLIVFGRRIGFTLREVGQLIGVWEDGAADTAQADALRNRFREKLVDLEKKKDAIDRSVEELRTVLARMEMQPV